MPVATAKIAQVKARIEALEAELLALEAELDESPDHVESSPDASRAILIETLVERIEDFTEATLYSHYAEKYCADYHFRREDLHAQLLDFLHSDLTTTVLVGKAGMGKSVAICDLAQNPPPDCTVWLQDCTHMKIDIDTSIDDHIGRSLGLGMGILDTVDRFFEENPDHRLVFVFDSINEFTGRKTQYHPERTPDEVDSDSERLVELRQILVEHFSEEDLRTLCFDLGVEYTDLGGEGRASNARELIAYLERRGRVGELVRAVKQRRSKVSWGYSERDTAGKTTDRRGAPEWLLGKLAEFVRRIEDPRIKLLVVCRTPIWNSLKRHFTVPLDKGFHTAGPGSYINTELFAREEVRQVYEGYRRAYRILTPFDQLSNQVKQLIAHPLFLRMVAEIYEQEEIPTSLALRDVFAQ
jgi:hypothetical protein